MKKEMRANIAWVCGIVLLLLAAALFILDGERFAILPGMRVSPQLAALAMTIIGVILVGAGSRK